MTTPKTAQPLKVYLASPLGFAESTRFFMEKKYKRRIATVSGLKALDPWKEDPKSSAIIRAAKSVNDLKHRRKAWDRVVLEIGAKNATLIDEADGIVAVLDGVDVDSGTAAEIGYGAAGGKWVIGYRQDLRRTGEDEAAEVNLQVEYFVRRNGGVIVHTLDQLVNELKRRKRKSKSGTSPISAAK